MLEKIVELRNVGRFERCSATGDVAFRRLTLIYGENGRGKSTLCDVLRSLTSGDPHLLVGRTTLGSAGEPIAHVRADGQSHQFNSGAWTTTSERVECFDERFVSDNVYVGPYVQHSHKLNLYRVIVGEEGVRLAKDVDRLDGEIRDVNKSIASTKKAVDRYVPKGMNIDTFIGLDTDADIDVKIANQQSSVSALEAADSIRRRSSLTKLTLPTLPDGVTDLLAKQLDDISADAEQKVRHHILSLSADQAESWLSQGLLLANATDCPFCGQQITGNELIASFRAFFGDSYSTLKAEVAAARKAIDRDFGEERLLAIQRSINDNASSTTFWESFVPFDAIPTISFEADVLPTLTQLRNTALSYMDRKLAAPLDTIPVKSDFNGAARVLDALATKCDDYNTAVASCNKSIADKKKEAESGGLSEARAKLERLRATKSRHSEDVEQVCQEYTDLLLRKTECETAKAEAKKALDEYSSTIFQKYESQINDFLRMSNAGFRIAGTGRSYVGGRASSTYQLVINDTPVELGDDDTPLSEPSFQNTLSTSERRTLALAFFFARLLNDPSPGNMKVIFDDPFTSQDRSRRKVTQQRIGKLIEMVEQVVVLSHDPSFLRLFWDDAPPGAAKALQLIRIGKSSAINEWDIEDSTSGEFFQMHDSLTRYCNEGTGDRRHIAQTVRPLLEECLRYRFPRQFERTEWLGDMIGKIRNADSSSPLAAAQAVLSELEAINDYSKRYHHSSAGAATESIDDGELEGYCRRTLDVVGGF